VEEEEEERLWSMRDCDYTNKRRSVEGKEEEEHSAVDKMRLCQRRRVAKRCNILCRKDRQYTKCKRCN